MNAKSGLARDLGCHMQEEIRLLLNRHLSVAQTVLTPVELGLIFVEAAVGIGLSAAATVATGAATDDDVEKLYNSTAEFIGQMLLRDRERALSAAVAHRSGGVA